MKTISKKKSYQVGAALLGATALTMGSIGVAGATYEVETSVVETTIPADEMTETTEVPLDEDFFACDIDIEFLNDFEKKYGPLLEVIEHYYDDNKEDEKVMESIMESYENGAITSEAAARELSVNLLSHLGDELTQEHKELVPGFMNDLFLVLDLETECDYPGEDTEEMTETTTIIVDEKDCMEDCMEESLPVTAPGVDKPIEKEPSLAG